jgi:hypothetical protein
VTAIFLHEHSDFPGLLRIIKEETGILAHLVEKDYWIMHCLHGLKRQGFNFQLKGGTSLSKGFGIIHRFSEDIDLHINPPLDPGINENPNNSNPKNIQKKDDSGDGIGTSSPGFGSSHGRLAAGTWLQSARLTPYR